MTGLVIILWWRWDIMIIVVIVTVLDILMIMLIFAAKPWVNISNRTMFVIFRVVLTPDYMMINISFEVRTVEMLKFMS